MEELNKNQVVLLTLLVSFVTSIATGIVTVTLMDQAPAGVNQTINRIVERTIERVVPGETKTTTVIKEVPVIVTEEKLVVDVINSASPSVVRIVDSGGVDVGSGFVVSNDGLVVTTEQIVPNDTSANYSVYFSSGRGFGARPVRSSANLGLSLLKLNLSDAKQLAAVITLANATSTPPSNTLPVLVLAPEVELLPGQTVIALGLPENGPIYVSGGIVSGIFVNTASTTEFIRSNAITAGTVGGPLLNIQGKAIGLNKESGLALTAKMVKQTLDGVAN